MSGFALLYPTYGPCGNVHGMKRVIIFRNELLQPSETFIKEQALALTDWHPVLVGYRRATNGLDLAKLDVRLLPGMTSGRLRRLETKLRQWGGKSHRATVESLKAIGGDLLHAHFGTDATDIWSSVKAAGLPMIVTLHGYDINIRREWWEAGHGGWRRRNYPRRLLRMAQDPAVHFIAVSKAIKARAIEYGIPEDKITVAYIGVDTQRFKPSGRPIEQRAKRILFVGRMVENKAPLLMVRAYAEVRRTVPDAELVMIGDGPLLREAKRLAAELSAPIQFLGACASDEVLAQMHQARVLCLPSVTTARGDAEGFGLVLIEAQACGVPAVTSAIGGATEAILDGETGYAFEPGSVTLLADKIAILLTDKATANQMSELSRIHVSRHFEITRLSRKLESIYTQATESSS